MIQPLHSSTRLASRQAQLNESCKLFLFSTMLASRLLIILLRQSFWLRMHVYSLKFCIKNTLKYRVHISSCQIQLHYLLIFFLLLVISKPRDLNFKLNSIDCGGYLLPALFGQFVILSLMLTHRTTSFLYIATQKCSTNRRASSSLILGVCVSRKQPCQLGQIDQENIVLRIQKVGYRQQSNGPRAKQRI